MNEPDESVVAATAYLHDLAQAGEITGLTFVGIPRDPNDEPMGLVGAIEYQDAKRTIAALEFLKSMLVNLMREAHEQVTEPEH